MTRKVLNYKIVTPDCFLLNIFPYQSMLRRNNIISHYFSLHFKNPDIPVYFSDPLKQKRFEVYYRSAKGITPLPFSPPDVCTTFTKRHHSSQFHLKEKTNFHLTCPQQYSSHSHVMTLFNDLGFPMFTS